MTPYDDTPSIFSLVAQVSIAFLVMSDISHLEKNRIVYPFYFLNSLGKLKYFFCRSQYHSLTNKQQPQQTANSKQQTTNSKQQNKQQNKQ